VADVTPELLTVVQVAEILGVHPRTVTNWCNEGTLKAIVLPSGRFRIRRDDLDALITT
jgi:excisionase family DNA binding protein